MATIALTTTPSSYIFNTNELSDLRKILSDGDRYTIITPVGSPSDLCLNEEGKTSNGYTYTAASLVQLCSLISPGLALLVTDLCGQWRKPGEDTRNFSSSFSIEILNRLIKLRCNHKLLNTQLIRNTKSKTIDGIVGSKYRYLANSDFLSRVEQECSVYKSKFHEACLYGRQFIVRYINQLDIEGIKAYTNYTIAGDSYNFGYHFANTEIGGTAVRVAILLVRNNTGDCILCPFSAATGGRVVHSGRDFEKKLHTLMGQIFKRLPATREIITNGDLLEHKNLWLGKEDHEKRIRYLAQILTRRKLTQTFARRVLASTSAKGRNNEDAEAYALSSEKQRVIQSRTGYDLVTSLIREAHNLPIDQREIAEQVAYLLLTGKINY